MTNTERAIKVERYALDTDAEVFINVRNTKTGAEGVAFVLANKKEVKFYTGNPDGSDDRVVSTVIFDTDFEIIEITNGLGITLSIA